MKIEFTKNEKIFLKRIFALCLMIMNIIILWLSTYKFDSILKNINSLNSVISFILLIIEFLTIYAIYFTFFKKRKDD